MIKRLILGLPIAAVLLTSCENKEAKRLQSQVDSLRTELQVSQQTAQQLEEVGTLIDSIDASRQLLRADVVEGTSYKDYKNRLMSINSHIKETQAKIAELENKVKKNGASLATIKRMRADLELSKQQIAALQQEVERVQGENVALSRKVTERDSMLTINSETIKLREQDVANLETKVEEINAQSQASQADLYFAQAQALETAAERTKFAPRKKKETRREALELNKKSKSWKKKSAEKVKAITREIG
jgi:chromosome segregation ATPase